MTDSRRKWFSEWLGELSLELMKKFGKEPNIHSIKSIDEVYLSVFHHRLYSYGKFLLIIVGMGVCQYLFSCSLSTPYTQVYGNLFTLSGSLIIARGLFQGRRRLPLTARDGRQFMMDGMLEEEFDGAEDELLYDWDDLVFAAFSTVDAIWGAFLLIIGFVLQTVVTLDITLPISWLPCF